MAMLDTALKEWKIVCDLMAEGQLALLLRKGGIHEDRGPGRFEMDHQRFLLFPSWLHQKPEMIKPGARDRVELLDEPERVTLTAYGEAANIWEVPSRPAMEKLDDLHCWTAAQLDMRFGYRPENPLFLVAVRVFRLEKPVEIDNLLEYGGCRSWVPLRAEHRVDPEGAISVVDDRAFAKMVGRIDETFAAAGGS